MSDLLEVEIWTLARVEDGNLVMLRPLDTDKVIPIFIGTLEAQSIMIGLDNLKVERPLTHDLFLNFAEQAGFSLFRAEVNSLKDKVFYARLYFTGPGYDRTSPLVIDARPSDALALAVRRRKCPVFVSREVMKKAGSPIDFVMEEKAENFRTLLQQELDKAVAAEEYERAAELRDRLNGLDKDGENTV